MYDSFSLRFHALCQNLSTNLAFVDKTSFTTTHSWFVLCGKSIHRYYCSILISNNVNVLDHTVDSDKLITFFSPDR